MRCVCIKSRSGRQTDLLSLWLLSQNNNLQPLKSSEWPLFAVILSAGNLIPQDLHGAASIQNHHNLCLCRQTTWLRESKPEHICMSCWGLFWAQCGLMRLRQPAASKQSRGLIDMEHTALLWPPPLCLSWSTEPTAKTQMPVFRSAAGIGVEGGDKPEPKRKNHCFTFISLCKNK